MGWFGGRAPESEAEPRTPPSPVDILRGFHQRTKHDFYRYAPGPPDLDWENQPDPFRRWEGTQVTPLELLPEGGGPTWSEALAGEVQRAELDPQSLSRFLLDSLGLSAWKEAGSARWSLRVNPSSGNLHPTEAHLLLPPVPGLSETARVAHYAPREHELEQRCELDEAAWSSLCGDEGLGDFFVGLTSIHWREAWKYGERAYRYCQHDVGHAIAALALAAAGLGWEVSLGDELSTDELAGWLGTSKTRWPEEEVPEVLMRVHTGPRSGPGPAPSAPPALTWVGRPTHLSDDHVEWEAIEVAARAASKPRTEPTRASLPSLTSRGRARAIDRPLRELVRTRRSAVAMDGTTSMSRTAFLDLLQGCLPDLQAPVWRALPWQPRIHLALFVHRVEDLEPGLYWLSRDQKALARAQGALRSEFRWDEVEADFPLYQLHGGNVRGLAARLSCGQEIAGDGAFSLGMIAEFEAALEEHGAWAYPRLFWESGAIGQCLYLEAEAQGLRGTGIGCFFDDPVHSTLGLRDQAWQSLYHFTIGGPRDDERLRTLAPYAHLNR
jgi:SagB-type dehydrogenase family enzyme